MSKTIMQMLIDSSNDYSSLEDDYYDLMGVSLLDPGADMGLQPPLEKLLSASIIIPAWNAADSILACLSAIEKSSFNLFYQDELEVVVVDDGSTDGTWELVEKADFSLNIKMVRQPHLGYSHARNAGVSVAKNDIIIFCDSDMVLFYHTIEQFVIRHKLLPNILLVGFRSNIDKTDNYADPVFINKHGSPRGTCFSEDDRIDFFVSGWPNNMCLATDHFKEFGFARDLWMPDKDAWTLPDMVFGALFSMSRKVYTRIGGSDERFRGWGCEDAYLAANAIALGHYIVPVYAASGLHIDHPSCTKDKESEYIRNRRQYFRFLKSEVVGGSTNWLPEAKKRILKVYANTFAGRVSLATEKPRPVNRKVETVSNKVDGALAIGEYSWALSQLDVSVADSEDGSILFKQGEALLGLRRYLEAIDVLSRSRNLNAEIALLCAQSAYGQFHAAHDTLESLFRKYLHAQKLFYWHDWTVQEHIDQGVRNKKQKFTRVAIRCFEIALAKDPNNKQAQKLRDACRIFTSN